MLNKISNRKILLLIFCFFIFSIKIDAALEEKDFNVMGTDGNLKQFDDCWDSSGKSRWNGCIGHGGWKFTIVKNLNTNTVKNVSYNSLNLETTFLNYQVVSGTETYFKNIPNYDFNSLVNEIKTGGNLFYEILNQTKVNKSVFFSESGYYILIEKIWNVYWDANGGTEWNYYVNKVMSGTSSEIAYKLMFSPPRQLGTNSDQLNGLGSVTQILPCTVYVKAAGSTLDQYCDNNIYEASRTYLDRYLLMSKNYNDDYHSRYGKGFVSINDIVGSITLTKKNSITNQNIKLATGNAMFQLYEGEACSGNKVGTPQKVNTAGILNFEKLLPGTYSIEETKAPDGYIGNDLPKCVHNKIEVNVNANVGVTVYNTPTCQVRLDDAKASGGEATPDELIAIFNDYPNYNNLLDFSNGGLNAACESAVCITRSTSDCLRYSPQYNLFKDDDFSCYDFADKDNLGKYDTFCHTTISLYNNLLMNKFYGHAGRFLIQYIEDTGIKYYSIIEAANNKLELEEKITSSSIATAILERVCYVSKDSYMDVRDPDTENLKLYFGDNNHDGDADLLSREELDIEEDEESLEYFDKYIYKISYNYNLEKVYLRKISGRPMYENIGDGNVISAFGVLSSFVSTNDDIKLYSRINQLSYKKIPFRFVNGDDEEEIYVDDSNNYCSYSTFPKIIEPGDDGERDELQLEFRIINTSNPFSGKNADCRDTNENWCDDGDCSCANDIVESVIIKGVNSYGMKQGVEQDPIYKITLTPSDIQLIREYNDENPYDNYAMYCDGEDDCVNAFIYDLSQEYLNQYETTDYRSTVDYSYGAISELIINKEEPRKEEPKKEEEVKPAVYVPKTYTNIDGYVDNIMSDSGWYNNIAAGSQSFLLKNNFNLNEDVTSILNYSPKKHNIDIKSCTAIGEFTSVEGKATNTKTVGANDSCKMDLQTLAPAPEYGDGNGYYYFYTLSITLDNGKNYKACIRIHAKRLGKFGVVNRTGSLQLDNCCLDMTTNDWRNQNCYN